MSVWDDAPWANNRENQLSRRMWSVFYRMQRIARREVAKAFTDVLLYGVGFVKIHGAEDPQVVSPWDVFIEGES